MRGLIGWLKRTVETYYQETRRNLKSHAPRPMERAWVGTHTRWWPGADWQIHENFLIWTHDKSLMPNSVIVMLSHPQPDWSFLLHIAPSLTD